MNRIPVRSDPFVPTMLLSRIVALSRVDEPPQHRDDHRSAMTRTVSRGLSLDRLGLAAAALDRAMRASVPQIGTKGSLCPHWAPENNTDELLLTPTLLTFLPSILP